MPMIIDPSRSRSILSRYREKRIPIPCFGAENTFTVEGILKGALSVAEARGCDVTVFVAATGRYHGRRQLENYCSLKDTGEGFLAFRDDLRRMTRSGGPFERVNVIAALDHGQPGLDDDLFEEGKGFWGCVMYDCSTLPPAENREKTAGFVKQNGAHYLVEGCVDEITESGDGKTGLTDPEQAENYLQETGVDLMVANLGTEHRATEAELRYRGDLARKISERCGNKLVLHGASSLSPDDLSTLGADGIGKVNIWTVLERKPTQDLAVELIRNITKILPASERDLLVQLGLLGESFAGLSEEKPALSFLTEVYRRDTIKVPGVARIVEGFMRAFGF